MTGFRLPASPFLEEFWVMGFELLKTDNWRLKTLPSVFTEDVSMISRSCDGPRCICAVFAANKRHVTMKLWGCTDSMGVCVDFLRETGQDDYILSVREVTMQCLGRP